MEIKKYDKVKYNKTYYEKNKEKLREKAKEQRKKMKEALQMVQASETSEPPPELEKKEDNQKCTFFLNASESVKGIFIKMAISGSLVASQAIYRAFRKTMEDRRENAPPPSVPSSNPLD
jgi:septal ring factor EnvC (AmiA/AmiB activator)